MELYCSLILDFGTSVQDRWETVKPERQLRWRHRWDTTLVVSGVLT